MAQGFTFEEATTAPAEAFSFKEATAPAAGGFSFEEASGKTSKLRGMGNALLRGGTAAVGSLVKGAGALSEVWRPGSSSDIEPYVPPEFEAMREQRAARKPSELIGDIQRNPIYEYGQALSEVAPEVHPVPPEQEGSFGVKAAEMAGGFVPLVAGSAIAGPIAGPAAAAAAGPAMIGLQSAGEHISHDFDQAKAEGLDDDAAADQALNRATASGMLQAAIFLALPAPIRAGLEKFLVAKLGAGPVQRWFAGRLAAGTEGAALGGTSRAAENVVEEKPVLEGTGSSGAGLAGANLLLPWLKGKQTPEVRSPKSESPVVPTQDLAAELQSFMTANQVAPKENTAVMTKPEEAAAAWRGAEERFRRALSEDPSDLAAAEQGVLEARVNFEASAIAGKLSPAERDVLSDFATQSKKPAGESAPPGGSSVEQRTAPKSGEEQGRSQELQRAGAELQQSDADYPADWTKAEIEADKRYEKHPFGSPIEEFLQPTEDNEINIGALGTELSRRIEFAGNWEHLRPDALEDLRKAAEAVRAQGRDPKELSDAITKDMVMRYGNDAPEMLEYYFGKRKGLTVEALPAKTEAAAAPETSTVRTATEAESSASRRTDEQTGSEMTAETGAIPARAAAATPTYKLSKPTKAESTRPADILDEIVGGHTDKIDLQSARKIQEDFKPRGAARKLFSGRGGMRVDELTDALRRKGVFPEDATEHDLLDAINAAADARKGWRKGVTGEQKLLQEEERQHVEFREDIAKRSQKTEALVPEDLNEGDQFTLRGAKFKVAKLEFDEDGRVTSVTLDDGKKYGTQHVGAETSLRMDKGTLKTKPGDVSSFAPSSEVGKMDKGPETPPPTDQPPVENARPEPTVSEVSAEKSDESQIPPKVEQAAAEPVPDKFEAWLNKAIDATNPNRPRSLEGVTGAPVWLTETLAHGALMATKAAYKAGKKLLGAIEVGVRWLQDQNITGFQENEARDWLRAEAERAGMQSYAGSQAEKKPSVPWEPLRDRMNFAQKRIGELQAKIDAAEKEGKPSKQLKDELRFAKRQYDAMFDAFQKNPDRLEDLILKHQQAEDDLRAARDRGLPDDIDRKKMAVESLQGWLESVPRERMNRIYSRLQEEGRIRGARSEEHEGVSPEASEGISPVNSPNPAAVRVRASFRPEPGKPWDESVPGVPWIPEALGKLRLMRARLAAWYRGRMNRQQMDYTMDAVDNRAGQFAKGVGNTALHALNRAFGDAPKDVGKRRELRELALSFVVEAKGERAALEEMKETLHSSEAARPDDVNRAVKAIEFAEDHLETMQPIAELYSRLTEMERAHELNGGLDVPEWRQSGYVYHLQDTEADSVLASQVGGSGILSQPYKHIRDYQTLARSIAAGVHPKSMNAIDLLQRRVAQGQKAVNQTGWLQALRGVEDPTTKQALVTDVVVRERPDGTHDITAPPGYTPVQYGPLKVALLKGYDGVFAGLTDPSWVRRSALKPVQKTFAAMKSTLLFFDTFHLGRLAAWKAIMTGKPTYRKGLTLMDNTPGELRTMAENGEIPREWVEGLEENKRRIDLALHSGFNVGQVADNMHADFIHSLPGIGTFNKWLFGQYQRGAMTEAWLLEFERMSRMLPDATEQTVARRVSKDLNARFGNLGRQGIFRSQTAQDLARLMFLAPQWNEALIRSELGFAKQLVTAPIESWRAGRVVAPTLLRAVGTMLVGQFVVNQLLNYMTRGKPTWENEEEGWGAKMSAWIPDVLGKGPGFFLHPFGLAAEITHLIIGKHDRKQDWTEALIEAGRSRLHPVQQGVATRLTKQTAMGRKLRPEEVWPETFKAMMPLPITAGAIGAAGRQAITGEHSEQFQGQFQKQLMASGGLKTDQAPGPEQRISNLARDFNREKHITPAAEFYAGDFQEMLHALRLGNKSDAKRALIELRTKKTDDQIFDHWDRWAEAPFTGKNEREEEFKRTLSAEQRRTYAKARSDRRQIRTEAHGLQAR